jgi:hypothetical protein
MNCAEITDGLSCVGVRSKDYEPTKIQHSARLYLGVNVSSESISESQSAILRNSYCPTCGRQYSGNLWKSLKCDVCNEELQPFELVEIVQARRRMTRESVFAMMQKISAQYSSASPYYCLRVYEVNSKLLITPKTGYSEIQRCQDLCDFLNPESETEFQKFADDLNLVIQRQNYDTVFQKLMSPDIWKTKDAGGRTLRYDPYQFRLDIDQHYRSIAALKAFNSGIDALKYVIDVYVQWGFESFDFLVYEVYSAAAQHEYYGDAKPNSIVTVQSKMGRRRPEWGWD